MAAKKTAKRGHPARGKAAQSVHLSVKVTDEEGAAVEQAMAQRGATRSELVREGLTAIGVLPEQGASTQPGGRAFVVGRVAGDELELRFSAAAGARLALSILQAAYGPESEPSTGDARTVTLQGKFIGKPK